MAHLNKVISISEDIKEEKWDSLFSELIKHNLVTIEQAQSFMAEDSEDVIEFDVTYEGTVVPYSSGTLECPPEGGYCEDDCVLVDTNNKLFLSRARKYRKIARDISTGLGIVQDGTPEYNQKAKKLRRKLQYKAQDLEAFDFTEYLESSTMERWSQEAYEKCSDY